MATTGVSVIEMDEGMDTGPIMAREEIPIDGEEDAGALGGRLARLGATLVVGTLDRLAAGDGQERLQDDAEATLAPKLRPEERVIDWFEPAERIVRRVRAFAPEPGATTTFRERPLKVIRARAQAVGWTSHPPVVGDLMIGAGGAPWIGAGDRRVVELVEVAPEGRKRIDGAAWLRGARPVSGERLG